MKITRMKCNRITNPLGFSLGIPKLSWVTDAPNAKKQKACQVQVATDESFNNILFDSGVSKDISSLGYALNMELKPRTRYFWRVKVWTDSGDVVSPVAWFETAKMNEQWKAQWITPDWEDKRVHPLLRKTFSVDADITSARVYVCGLGLYELEINGERVGDEYLTPYCNAYDKWLQYQTYDVTHLLNKGNNAIGAMLGNGWYKGRFGFGNFGEALYGDTFALLCELVVQYSDGRVETIISDESWKAAPGPVMFSDIYDGEIQDARKRVDGYSKACFDDSSWSGVKTVNINSELLEARRSLPVRIMEQRKPVKVIKTPKNETVLDMGQNMVGWLQFKVNAPKGSEIFLQYGEELQDGCFYRENLRSAKAEFRYISNGETALVQPYFTFYGFRYVKIEGWPDELRPEDFTGCVVYSDMERTGTIETSNPFVNKLFQNALWSQKGNFLDVPTDCPQRDERMGWTGDAQVFSGTASFNMDVYAFFNKYLYDLSLEQKERNGRVPNVIPTFRMGKEHGDPRMEGGACGWGDAATIIPWCMYLFYGDEAILKQQFDSMKAWVDFIHSQDDGSRLWNKGLHYGDWLALDGPDPLSPMGGTPNDFVASAFYKHSAELVAKAARVLGKEDVAAKYQQLANEVKKAIQDEFFSPRGRIAVNTQTAHVLALFMDLVPGGLRDRVADALKQKLMECNYHLKTGFLGTPYLCRVLSENGYNDLAYTLLINDDFPSWLYEVKMGATTIWERWNSLLPNGKFAELGMNSLNHYAYGSIVEWMYRNMCGINPMEEYPGFRKIRLAPKPDGRLQWAKAALDTPVGRYQSSWQISENGLTFEFNIPFNASADLVLPDASIETVRVNGINVTESSLSAKQMGTSLFIEIPSGSYIFEYVPTKAYIVTFSTKTSVQKLIAHPKTRAVLQNHIPQIVEVAQNASFSIEFGEISLIELSTRRKIKVPQEVLDSIDLELSKIKGWDW